MSAGVLQDRVAIVTGGSRGIGRAVVECFAEAGARVHFTYVRNEEAAAEVEAACPSATGIRCDGADLAAVDEVVGGIKQQEGRLGD